MKDYRRIQDFGLEDRTCYVRKCLGPRDSLLRCRALLTPQLYLRSLDVEILKERTSHHHQGYAVGACHNSGV